MIGTTAPHQTSVLPAVPGVSLESQIRAANHLHQVRKTDLRPGDWILVKTLRSTYCIKVKRSGRYEVSGGWFDQKGLSPTELGIAGCTWGGSVIKIDIIAACGLRLEFANRLVTSPIQRIVVVHHNGAQ
jgi:hypothetical protein